MKTYSSYPLRPLLLAMLFCALLVSRLEAGTPTAQIRDTVEKVLAILRNPELKSAAMQNERREKLRKVIYPRFDFGEMAKRSLGPQWQRLSPKQRQEFVAVFTDLLEEAYVDQIESYQGEKVVFVREAQEKGFAEVESKVVTPKGEEFVMHYKLHPADKEWKVYDIVVENISLVNNYRSQFNRVLARSSYEELLRRIKNKRFKGTDKNADIAPQS